MGNSCPRGDGDGEATPARRGIRRCHPYPYLTTRIGSDRFPFSWAFMAAATAGGAMGFCFPCSVAKDEDPDLGPYFLQKAEAVAERAAAEEKRQMEKGGDEQEEDEEEEWADLEPFFYDEAAAVADHEKAMQREQRRALAEKLQESYLEAQRRLFEYDPEQGRSYYTRPYFLGDWLDLDEESPLGPMRETDALIDVDGTVCTDGGGKQSYGRQKFVPCNSVNVFSVDIASCDVGFPIDVYGTVIARDSLDEKCVYLFRRDRGHSQLILTKDEPLILSGPKRGLALSYEIYFEYDLKIKGARKQSDRQLSKGFIKLNGIPHMFKDKQEVESLCLDTRLSKLAIKFVAVMHAVEATFAVEVVQGSFYGEIAARTSSIRDTIVLHDSRLAEAKDGNGLQLLRRVVAVGLKEKLIVTVVARTSDGKAKSTTTKFTPRINGGDEEEVSCGFVKMRVKVIWSIIERIYL